MTVSIHELTQWPVADHLQAKAQLLGVRLGKTPSGWCTYEPGNPQLTARAIYMFPDLYEHRYKSTPEEAIADLVEALQRLHFKEKQDEPIDVTAHAAASARTPPILPT